MRSSAFLFLTVVVIAALCAGISGAPAGPLPSLQLLHPASPLLTAKSKCKLKVVCDYFAPANTCKHPPCCKKWHLEKVCAPKDSGTPKPDDKAVQNPSCPKGIDPKTGKCDCGPGWIADNDGGCYRPCGYGMTGKPPNCRCPTGAKLQVTGPTTKGCLCPNGKPPVDIGGGFDCPDYTP
jgi:hypothetical protein